MKFLSIALFVLSISAQAEVFKCSNYDGEEVLQLVIGETKNHILLTKFDPPLKRGESATWSSVGLNRFPPTEIVSNVRTITIRGKKTGTDSIQINMGYDLDPACPSCESGHASSNQFDCKLTKNVKADPKKYFEYVREPHYPTESYFQSVMREVAEDFWGPRAQITLVNPKNISEYQVINFDNNQIWLHGYFSSSGPNDFMEENIRRFLKFKPIILKEATTKAGKCQFDSLLKGHYPNKECDKLLKGDDEVND